LAAESRTMTIERPPTIDPQAAQRWAAQVPPTSAWLHEEVARRMEQRLQWLVQQPTRWLHWEPLQGGLQSQALLARRYPKSECYVFQPQAAQQQLVRERLETRWWQPAHWTGTQLKFDAPAQPVQMLWANMALHMAADPQTLIARWHAALETHGFLMFSCLGPDTLLQLRRLYAALGWPPPSHEFTDMHDWGDMLVHAGFEAPVMDMERITLSYSSAETLLEELRGLGRNLHPQRFAGLRTRRWRDRLCSALQRELADPDQPGRLQLTFEIVYGHAFKASPRHDVSAQSVISLAEMRAALSQSKPAGRTN
jgi:malonyl-CoA O-methyltransferase